jgi:hypothetical protein
MALVLVACKWVNKRPLRVTFDTPSQKECVSCFLTGNFLDTFCSGEGKKPAGFFLPPSESPFPEVNTFPFAFFGPFLSTG